MNRESVIIECLVQSVIIYRKEQRQEGVVKSRTCQMEAVILIGLVDSNSSM